MITPDWDEFHSILLKNNIPQNQHHYYVKWIENFLLFFQTLNASTNDSLSISVSSIEAKHINHFLQDIDRNIELMPWQFRQLLHALRLVLIPL